MPKAREKWGRRVLVGLVCGFAACTTPPPTSQPTASPSAKNQEDVESNLLSQEEVDVPAALRAPLDPIYPEQARLEHREGDVVARVAVRADGAVIGVSVLEAPDPAFGDAAEEALWRGSFAPARKGRNPVSSTATLRVQFRMER